MRKRIKLSLALFVPFIATAVALSGCSSSKSDQPDTPLPDASSLLSESAAFTKTQTSTHIVLSTSGDQPLIKIGELTADLTSSPALAAQGNAKIRMGTGNQTTDANFVVVDGDIYTDVLGGKMMNFGPVDKVYDISVILDPKRGLANLLSNITNAKSEGRDTIDGVNSVRISGTLSKAALNTFDAETKAVPNDVPAQVWVADDAKHELTKISIETSSGNTIAMSLSDWGKQFTVAKP